MDKAKAPSKRDIKYGLICTLEMDDTTYVVGSINSSVSPSKVFGELLETLDGEYTGNDPSVIRLFEYVPGSFVRVKPLTGSKEERILQKIFNKYFG